MADPRRNGDDLVWPKYQSLVADDDISVSSCNMQDLKKRRMAMRLDFPVVLTAPRMNCLMMQPETWLADIRLSIQGVGGNPLHNDYS